MFESHFSFCLVLSWNLGGPVRKPAAKAGFGKDKSLAKSFWSLRGQWRVYRTRSVMGQSHPSRSHASPAPVHQIRKKNICIIEKFVFWKKVSISNSRDLSSGAENLADSHHAALADSDNSNTFRKTVGFGLPPGISIQDMSFSWKVDGCKILNLGSAKQLGELGDYQFALLKLCFLFFRYPLLGKLSRRSSGTKDCLCEGLRSKGSDASVVYG